MYMNFFLGFLTDGLTCWKQLIIYKTRFTHPTRSRKFKTPESSVVGIEHKHIVVHPTEIAITQFE